MTTTKEKLESLRKCALCGKTCVDAGERPPIRVDLRVRTPVNPPKHHISFEMDDFRVCGKACAIRAIEHFGEIMAKHWSED